MGKSNKKQTIKYIILPEEKPMTLAEIEKLEHELAKELKIEQHNQLDLLIDLVFKR